MIPNLSHEVRHITTVPTLSTTWGNMKTRYLPEATTGAP
jgi:hypothetical protein